MPRLLCEFGTALSQRPQPPRKLMLMRHWSDCSNKKTSKGSDTLRCARGFRKWSPSNGGIMAALVAALVLKNHQLKQFRAPQCQGHAVRGWTEVRMGRFPSREAQTTRSYPPVVWRNREVDFFLPKHKSSTITTTIITLRYLVVYSIMIL